VGGIELEELLPPPPSDGVMAPPVEVDAGVEEDP